MFVQHGHSRRAIIALSLLSGAIAVVTSGASLLNTWMYDGRMRYELIAGSVGFDAVSLVAGAALIACCGALRARRETAWLIWTGLQGYLWYAYSLYAFALVFTPLFIAYLVIASLSTFALLAFWRAQDPGNLDDANIGGALRLVVGGALITLAAGFGMLWLVTIVGVIGTDLTVPAATVMILDLVFVLPALATIGVLVLRRRPLGYLLATGALGMSTAILLGVAAGEVSRPLLGGDFFPMAALPYFVPGIGCGLLTLLWFRKVTQRNEDTPAAIGVPSSPRHSLRPHSWRTYADGERSSDPASRSAPAR